MCGGWGKLKWFQAYVTDGHDRLSGTYTLIAQARPVICCANQQQVVWRIREEQMFILVLMLAPTQLHSCSGVMQVVGILKFILLHKLGLNMLLNIMKCLEFTEFSRVLETVNKQITL